MTISPASQSLTSLRMLVVDDNEATTKTFGWMLEALGHDVRLANDGPSAIAIAQSYVPHVIILDISLPGMSGYEVCQKLRAEPVLENSVLVAQTGWSQPEYRERSRMAGFHHHLVKPVTLDRMQALIASLDIEKDRAVSC